MDVTGTNGRVVVKLEKALGGLAGKRIGVLGLSFKPNTDDIREAPALDIIRRLLDVGAVVQAYDPQAMKVVKENIPVLICTQTPYQAAEGADALLLATEWNEFKSIDFDKVRELMQGRVILDGRNIWDPEDLRALGFIYMGVGVASPRKIISGVP